jgi:hypothetical protein
MDLRDFVFFFETRNICVLEGAILGHPRIVDLTWPDDKTKADTMNTRIFETTRDFHGTTKTLSPVQAIAELEPADATALLTTISKLCNYDATQHANLMWLMGLLTSIAVCLEATEQEDLLDIHKALCGDSYEFLMAAFNPDHLESTLIDIESCSPDILDGISEILATMH